MSPASQICLVVESPASFDRVTCLPPKNASAPWGGVGSRQLTIIVWQVSYVQYLLACQKSQRSTPYNIVKSGLPWKRVFRRRHLGRRVTAVTCLRWLTVYVVIGTRHQLDAFLVYQRDASSKIMIIACWQHFYLYVYKSHQLSTINITDLRSLAYESIFENKTLDGKCGSEFIRWSMWDILAWLTPTCKQPW